MAATPSISPGQILHDTASQAGDSNFNAAGNMPQTFHYSAKAKPDDYIQCLSEQVVGGCGKLPNVSATATSA